MMTRVFYFLIFSILPLLVSSQSVVVFGSVTDSKSGNPIEGVYINHKRVICKSNDEGVFSYRINPQKGEQITFKHINYEEKSITLKNYYLKRIYKDTLFLKVSLKEKEFELPEVAVYAEKAPDTVFGSPAYSVEDFIITDNNLILLAYEKSLNKGSTLLVTDANQNIDLSLPLSFYATYLYTDYAKKHYVVGEKQAFEIKIEESNLRLIEQNFESFSEFTQRIVDSVGGKYYFTNYQDIYPAFNFYSARANDTVVKLLHSVKDDFMMELYLSEYKYIKPQEKLWAVRQEVKTGIDKEIWIGAKYFTHSLYYKPVYAPMTIFGDTAYIFDHYDDKIFTLSCNDDTKTDSISISYHNIMGKNDKWKQPLIFDAQKENAYALFQNRGNIYLRKINLITGKIDLAVKLYYRYVHKISVHNGYAYYTYRPFESSQKKFIYRERIE